MAVDDLELDADGELMDLPTFELRYAVDDESDPSHVVVYPAGVRTVDTRWIAMDAAHTVALDDVP